MSVRPKARGGRRTRPHERSTLFLRDHGLKAPRADESAPPTRVAVATCRRMVVTQAVSRAWHQRGSTGLGRSCNGSRGKYRTARQERLFVFGMGRSGAKRWLPAQAAIAASAICTGRHADELLKATTEMAL